MRVDGLEEVFKEEKRKQQSRIEDANNKLMNWERNLKKKTEQ